MSHVSPIFLSRSLRLLIVCILSMPCYHSTAEEIVIDFENCEIGKPVLLYADQDVVFDLSHAPKKSRAKGRLMFFPHLGDDRKGILNAMADEAIPLRIKLPRPASQASLRLWGSTTSSALVEAFDQQGNLLTQAMLAHVPVRQSPEEQVPYFRLTVASSGISTIHVSGSQPGGFIALEEIRIVIEGDEPAPPAENKE
jgi:hypothetical protein